MNVERTRKYADVHIPGSARSKTDFSSTPVSAGNERRSRLPYAITKLLPYVITKLLPYVITKLLPYAIAMLLPYVITKLLTYAIPKLLLYAIT